MLESPRVGAVAVSQLAAWQTLAASWESHAVQLCDACGRGIYLLTDSAGSPYQYTPGQVLALTVLHLRNHHADLDPDRAL